MSSDILNEEAVLEILGTVQDPDLNRDIVSLGFIKDLVIDGSKVSFKVELTTPACPVKEQLKMECFTKVSGIPGVEEVDVEMTAQTRQANPSGGPTLPGVKNIVAVASGKGGVGKTFMVANLAIALAQLGKRVIAADLDFGGSNLYTHLGFDNRHPGIAHFISSGDTRLDELLVKTRFDGLHFLPGEVRMPFLANMGYCHKQKLLLNLSKLDTDYVLLDLGAGTSFTVLDFFSISTKGMLVTTLDYPSLMNMLQFLKNHDARSITEHETVSIPVPRTTRLLGLMVTSRKRSRCTKSSQCSWRGSHFSPTNQHYFRLIILNHIGSDTYIVRTGCAS